MCENRLDEEEPGETVEERRSGGGVSDGFSRLKERRLRDTGRADTESFAGRILRFREEGVSRKDVTILVATMELCARAAGAVRTRAPSKPSSKPLEIRSMRINLFPVLSSTGPQTRFQATFPRTTAP
jgi:hypothetical protein